MMVAAAVLLVAHWRGRNAVWGGATLGAVAGVLWWLIGGTPWLLILKVGAIGALCGFLAELVGIASRVLRGPTAGSLPVDNGHEGGAAISEMTAAERAIFRQLVYYSRTT